MEKRRKIAELLVAANKFAANPLEREGSLKQIIKLLSDGDQAFLDEAKYFLSKEEEKLKRGRS